MENNVTAAEGTNDAPVKTPWKAWQKLTFRFFLLFFGITSILVWAFTIYQDLLGISFHGIYTLYKPLAGLLYWLDKHIYHTGYNPKAMRSIPLDNHYGAVYYLTVFLFCLAAAVAWSVADKKNRNYDRLFYWFNLFLRYTLAITILGYGIDKIIPVQMPYPNAFFLKLPFGDFSKNDLLWNFIGVSPGYSIFSGACETIAGLLLLSRRTAVFGYVFLLTIFGKVVAIKWFYNINVKFYSSLLLCYTIYLLAPYAPNLFRLFFKSVPVSIPQPRRVFKTRWKGYLLTAVLLLLPLIYIVRVAVSAKKNYAENAGSLDEQKMYKVTSFKFKDSLSQMAPDTFRWKRIFIWPRSGYLVTWDMSDKYNPYEFKTDSLKRTYTFTKPGNIVEVLNYTYSPKNLLELNGKWKGKNIQVALTLSPIDSITLKKEKITLVHPEQD